MLWEIMDGFFDKDDVATATTQPRMAQCGACKLNKGCTTPRMPYTGQGKLGVLIVAEAPGQQEDATGTQLVGQAGQRLRTILAGLDVDLDRDCWKTNAIICRPPKNREPTEKEIVCCRPNLLKVIAKTKPKVIITLGASALNAVIGARWEGDIGSVARWRGQNIPDRHFGAWVCPTYHPSYLLRYHAGDVCNRIFEQDLDKALDKTEEPFPKWADETEVVRITRDPAKVHTFLDRILEAPMPMALAYDWETTGLKPQAKGHKIATVGFSHGPNHGAAFPMRVEYLPKMVEIFTHPQIYKIAHGAKFEEMWTRAKCKCRVTPWGWCTQLGSHVCDNRKGKVNDLKFQSYVHFGLMGYEREIKPFLEGYTIPEELLAPVRDNDILMTAMDSPGKCANALNNIFKAPLRKLLTYNAIDAMCTFRHAMVQAKQLGVPPWLQPYMVTD